MPTRPVKASRSFALPRDEWDYPRRLVDQLPRGTKGRDEDDVVLLTVFQNVLRATIGHAIAILYTRDGHDRARVMKLAHAHFR